ncbi:MAG: CBS domain-containing protein [Candidatus Thiodiazotropha taylori]|nr:CBS domain-containing protein [Candidatus Thiodiazotropha taylori]
MACRVGKLISEPVSSLDSDTDILTASRFMADNNLGSLVVMDKQQVSGLFTERDLLVRVVGAGQEPAALKLSDVCTKNLVSVHYDSSCANTIKLMRSNKCRRLLIYKNDELQGLVNISDVAHALADHSSGKNMLVNFVGGVTLVVVLMVIGVLISHFPDMLQLAGHTMD